MEFTAMPRRFSAMSQKDLMILARERNLKGRSKMRKADLVKALHEDELERKEERRAWREEKKWAKAERKAELKERRKEVKRRGKEVREKKLMRAKSEIKETKKAREHQRRGPKARHSVRTAEPRTKSTEGPAKRSGEGKEKTMTKGPRKSKKDKGRKGDAPNSNPAREVKVTTRKASKRRPQPIPLSPESLRDTVAFTPEVIQSRSSLKGFARQYVYEGVDGVGPREFLEMHEKPIIDILEYHTRTKAKIILKCLMEKRDLKTGEIVEKEAVFHSRVEVNLEGVSHARAVGEGDDKEGFFQRASDKIMEDMATYTSTGSGWRFKRFIVLEVHLVDYVPLKGNSFIPLPEALKGKKAVINMKNEDDECFKWCVTRALNPVESHPERITRELRRQSEELDWSKMSFPIELNKIGKFESSNEGIGVNVFGYEKGVYPLRISAAYARAAGAGTGSDHGKKETSGRTLRSGLRPSRLINLLLIEEDGIRHYCLIKNISRLLSSQVSKDKRSKVFCLRCLNHFPNEEKLAIHEEYCRNNECVRLVLPSVNEKGSAPILKLKNFVRKMKVTDVVYADFEALTEKISSCQPDPRRSFTHQYQKHEPCGFAYQVVCFDESVYSQEPVIYRMEDEGLANASLDLRWTSSEALPSEQSVGPSAQPSGAPGHEVAEARAFGVAQKFVDTLEENIKKIHRERDSSKKMIFTKSDRRKHSESTCCWICGFPLKDYKVKDHCHFTGKYRGAAHNVCNLKFEKPKFTPVIFHNLSGYDSHLFVKNLGKSEGVIKCIPNNEEKYISFSKHITVGSYIDKNGKEVPIKHELRFIDSAKFMASSLDSLVSNLVKSGTDKLKQTKKDIVASSHSTAQADRRLKLLTRKGVYPYDYMDGVRRFSEKSLPPKQDFYSRLNDSHISDEDYEHAQKVWKEFGCENMGDYHDLYLKTDVLLLADVFEEFREVCLRNYELDPAWYYTAPGLAWDAALKYTSVNLELLTDVDMLLMFEKGIRGGVSMISHRHGKANNPYMGRSAARAGGVGEKYDPSHPTKYVEYLDANNLYGWAMCKPLSIGGFRWMSEEELNALNLDLPRGEFSPGGPLARAKRLPACVLEVDLEYPRELHDLHNEYPLAPERLEINGVEKLVPNLNDKEKYVIHSENLDLYERLGLKVKKIHRGISFKEKDWLRPYIELNTGLRANAKNDFEKDFFKLMNNSVFGKMMENIRKRIDVKLANSRRKAEKLVSRPNFKNLMIFGEDFVSIHMERTRLYFDKPVYCGMTILDLSKKLMYNRYDYIKKKYPAASGLGSARLLFTDTDSLAYEIQTEDFYKDITPDVRKGFDTSNYPKEHPSGIPTGLNKKIPGLMKDEAGGKIIEEFIGLRAKLYSYKMCEGKEEKKCKGVKKSVVKKNITHDDYKRCLLDKKGKTVGMNVIRSRAHEVFTETVNKKALSWEDDKRVIQDDGIHTLAHGHYACGRTFGGLRPRLCRPSGASGRRPTP